MTKVISEALFNSVAKQVQTRLHTTYIKNSQNKYFETNPSVSSLFFKPFNNRYDFYTRAASVPLGVIGLGIQGVEDLVLSFESFLGAVVNLLSCDWLGAKNGFKCCFNFLLVAVEELLMAIVSPLVNLVDLLGSGVKTLGNSISKMTSSYGTDKGLLQREYDTNDSMLFMS